MALEASGGADGDRVWTLRSGRLPAGLELTSPGRIMGTPTAPGTAALTVSVSGGAGRARASFDLRVAPDDTSGYDLTLVPAGPLSPALTPHVEDARARWEDVVTGDLPSVTVPPGFFGPGFCGGRGEALNGASADDLILLVEVADVDGAGSVIGRAGPCALRGGGLPFVGTLTLDAADLPHLLDTDGLTELVIHEIAHGMGFGALWQRLDLIEGGGTDDPRYPGPNAVSAYRELGGEGDVPLQATGGRGSAGSHWRESEMNSEVMTALKERAGVAEPLSSVTAGAMADLGYEVDLAAADPYSLPSPRGAVASAAARDDPGYDVVIRGLIRVLLEDGRATTIGIPERR